MLRVTANLSLPLQFSPLFLPGRNPNNLFLVSSYGCGFDRTPVEERKHDNTRTRNRPFGAGLYDRFCGPETKGKEAIEVQGQRNAVSQIEQRIRKVRSKFKEIFLEVAVERIAQRLS